MSTIREALAELLECLGKQGGSRYWCAVDKARAAIAAQPAQEAESDWTEVDLWAEIHKLRAAVKGPDGYASWQDAATDERIRRVKAERALAAQPVQPAPAYVPLTDEQIKAIWWQCESKTRDSDPRHEWWNRFARAVEKLVVERMGGKT